MAQGDIQITVVGNLTGDPELRFTPSGAAVANYVELVQARREDGRWVASLRDTDTGEELTLTARVIVNAAGPFVDDLNAAWGLRTGHRIVYSKGIHLVVPRLTTTRHDRVLAFFDDTQRLFYVIPMGRRSVIGTTDTRVDTPFTEPTDDDIDFLLTQINARMEGNELVENHYFDIGVAVGTKKGLVVPVLRDCDQLGFAEIEQSIVQYAEKARTGGITLQDMQGGCFTITNGGIYGSLLSTPIINPPQSGILGMHSIQERPVAVNGEVVIRPMMYTALSYDHRVVDGKEAVTFLVKLKEAMEDPARLALGI